VLHCLFLGLVWGSTLGTSRRRLAIQQPDDPLPNSPPRSDDIVPDQPHLRIPLLRRIHLVRQQQRELEVMCYVPQILRRADDLRGGHFELERGGLVDMRRGVGR